MSRLWKRQRWGKLALACEQLEARETPAGNITVSVVGGVLTMRGLDDDFHAFNLAGAGGSKVAIRTAAGTTINGLSQDVIFVDGITRGYDIQLGSGSDSVVVSGVNGRSFLSIDTGGGDDAVHIVNGTHSRDSTVIRTGDGNDLLILSGSTFREHFAFVGGAGNDRVEVGVGNDFEDNNTFDGGDGTDTLNRQSNRFRSAARVLNFETQGSKVAAPVAAASGPPGPTARADTGTVAFNKTTAIAVLSNDDVGTGTFSNSTLRVTSGPSKGTATVQADGTIAYVSTGTAGTDTFRYYVANSDGRTSNETTVTVTVSANPDSIGPVGTITSTTSATTKTTPIDFKVAFDEAVTGFEAGDITVSGGTLTSGSFTGSGTTYNFTVTPSTDGTVSVSVPAGVAKDSAGNNNQAIAAITRVFDATDPTVTIGSTTGATTNLTPIPVTITFSESVTGFDQSDVTVTGGTIASGSFTGSGASYTLNVTPTGDGAVTVNVAAGVATDTTGNTNQAATALTRTFDGTAPTPTISSTAQATTGTSPIPFTVTFNENVTGFTADDVTVTNGTVGNFAATDAKVYTFSVTPTADGVVTVNVPAAAALDTASNASTAATSFSRTFDTASPSVALASTAGDPTKVSPIPYTATFSKDVTGFDVSDISVTNGTAGSFVATDASHYTFSVTPTNQGTVTVSVAAGVATGNGKDNLASGPLTRVFDTVPPSGSITTLTTNDTTPTITGSVFEKNTTVTVTVAGQTVNASVDDSKLTYTATFPNVIADGTYTISIGVTDKAGNTGGAFSNQGLIIDTVQPSVDISSSETNPTKAATIPIQFQFNEVMTGFTQSDLVVSNGTLSNFDNPDGQFIAVDITPSGDGVITLTLPSGSAFDPAGNGNKEATFTITSDRTGPVLTIATKTVGPTNLASIPFTVTANEALTGFDQSDLAITNGSAANFSMVDAKTYTFDVTPAADGSITVAIAKDAATDALGNGSSEAAPASITSDRTGPTLTLSSSEATPSKASKFSYTAQFGENVTGFTGSDLTITNGTLSNFVAVDGDTYTFDLTPEVEGDVTVQVDGDVATDMAGNGNGFSNEFTIRSDTTPPNGLINSSGTVAITGTALDQSTIVSIGVSIFNGSNYWDGTSFSSVTEVFNPATSVSSNFQNWSYAFAVPGTYAVRARILDSVGFTTTISNTVTIT